MTNTEERLHKDFPWLKNNFITKDRKIKIKKGDENLFMMKASEMMEYFIISNRKEIKKIEWGKQIHELINKDTSEIVSISRVSYVMTIYKLCDEIKEEFFYTKIGERIMSFIDKFGKTEAMRDKINEFLTVTDVIKSV